MRFGGLYISHAWGRTRRTGGNTRHSSLPATIDKYTFGSIYTLYYRRPDLCQIQILQPHAGMRLNPVRGLRGYFRSRE